MILAVFFCQTWIIDLPLFSNSYEGVIFMVNIPTLPNEEWKEIKGYGGKYLISNMGRCASLKRGKPRLLTAFPNNKGYWRVALSNDG